MIAYGNNDWKQLASDGSTHTLNDVRNKLKENIKLIRSITQSIKIIGILETNKFSQKSKRRVHGRTQWVYVSSNG